MDALCLFAKVPHTIPQDCHPDSSATSSLTARQPHSDYSELEMFPTSTRKVPDVRSHETGIHATETETNALQMAAARMHVAQMHSREAHSAADVETVPRVDTALRSDLSASGIGKHPAESKPPTVAVVQSSNISTSEAVASTPSATSSTPGNKAGESGASRTPQQEGDPEGVSLRQTQLTLQESAAVGDRSRVSGAPAGDRSRVSATAVGDRSRVSGAGAGDRSRVSATSSRSRRVVLACHCDIIGDQFWQEHPEILEPDHR